MGDSICDIMMKEHEKFLKTHTVIHACSHKPKTPYQLDLEVKDRKPDIVPKVGDKVKIKSREWYEKWKDDYGNVTLKPLIYWGNGDWVKHLGRIYSVKSIHKDCFFLNDCPAYVWTMNMFEEVFPQESLKEERYVKTFDSSSINASALGKQLAAASFIPEINPKRGPIFSYDLGTLSRQVANIKAWTDTSPRTNLPQNCFGRTSAVVHQDFFKKEEPELQTIKKHRFIKLEKL